MKHVSNILAISAYKRSTHISFMDHAYVNPQQHLGLPEEYFNGTLKERKVFVETVRKDVEIFLKESGL